MKKFSLVLSIFLFTTSAAEANVLYLHCQRYRSTCTAEKCYQIADGLSADSEWRGSLPASKLEQLDFVVRENDAMMITENNLPGMSRTKNNKYTVLFDKIMQDPARIQMEITSDKAVKERVSIIKRTGFYSAYMLHTDTSIKDIPIGTPYTAYFGWCDDTTATDGVYTPTAEEPKPDAATPAPTAAASPAALPPTTPVKP